MPSISWRAFLMTMAIEITTSRRTVSDRVTFADLSLITGVFYVTSGENQCAQRSRDKDVARSTRRWVQDAHPHLRYAALGCCLGIDKRWVNLERNIHAAFVRVTKPVITENHWRMPVMQSTPKKKYVTTDTCHDLFARQMHDGYARLILATGCR